MSVGVSGRTFPEVTYTILLSSKHQQKKMHQGLLFLLCCFLATALAHDKDVHPYYAEFLRAVQIEDDEHHHHSHTSASHSRHPHHRQMINGNLVLSCGTPRPTLKEQQESARIVYDYEVRQRQRERERERQQATSSPVTTEAPVATSAPTTAAPVSSEPTTQTPVSAEPVQSPSAEPVQSPVSAEPVQAPVTEEPSQEPSSKPSPKPTPRPTLKPAPKPTPKPTAFPTKRPTKPPTMAPTEPPTYDIDIYVHIIARDRNSNTISNNQLQRYKATLDNAFASTPFRFHIKQTFRHTHRQFHRCGYNDFIQQIGPFYRRGRKADLNLYFCDITVDAGGWAYFPTSDVVGKGLDGVVLERDLTKYGLASNFVRPMVLPHEVGHWLGLFHTFEVRSVLLSCTERLDVSNTNTLSLLSF